MDTGQPTPAPKIVLHRTAPWNDDLRGGGRDSYAQVGDRKFHVENNGGIYFIYEVGHDGLALGWEAAKTRLGLDRERHAEILDKVFVGLAYNRGGSRIAIQRYLAGDTRDQIDAAVRAYGKPGTGRNSPANVARRRGRR